MRYFGITLFLFIALNGFCQSKRDSLLLDKILYRSDALADTNQLDPRVLGVLKSIDRNIYNFLDTNKYYYPISKKIMFSYNPIKFDTLINDKALLIKQLLNEPTFRNRLMYLGNDTSALLNDNIVKDIAGLYFPENQFNTTIDTVTIDFNRYNALLKNIVFYSDSINSQLRATIMRLKKEKQAELLDYIKHRMRMFSKTEQKFYSNYVYIQKIVVSSSGLVYVYMDACPTGYFLTFDLNKNYALVKVEKPIHITHCWSPVEEDRYNYRSK